MKIGYASRGSDLSSPGDRRRFVHYAQRRGLPFEVARRGERYDAVVVTAMADLGAWRAVPRPTRLLFDIVDSYLAIPRANLRGALRGVAKFAFGRTRGLHLDYRRLIQDTCRRADVVVCATEEQRQDILPLCPNAHVVLDFLTEIPAVERTRYEASAPFRLVWEGLPWNLQGFTAIAGPLADVAARHPLALDVVTAPTMPLLFHDLGRRAVEPWARSFLPLGDVTFHPWSVEALARASARADLAVIPLPLDDAFMRGKPENKLVGFWKQGVPALVSATPAYERAMRGAGLDGACATPADWTRALERMIAGEAERRDAGVRGRIHAERAYGEAVLLDRWDRAFAALSS